MNISKDCLYTKDHEWLKAEGEFAYIGVTDYAAQEMGDVVFVELPAIGKAFGQEDTMCEIESPKAVAGVLAPVACEVTEVNSLLEDDPSLINEDAYANWIAKVRISDPSQLDSLMSPEAYERLVDELEAAKEQ